MPDVSGVAVVFSKFSFTLTESSIVFLVCTLIIPALMRRNFRSEIEVNWTEFSMFTGHIQMGIPTILVSDKAIRLNFPIDIPLIIN